MRPQRRVPSAALVAAVALTLPAPVGAVAASQEDVIVTVSGSDAVSPAALRRAPSLGQREVLRTLARERRHGRVRVARRFWVFDGLHVVADRGVVARLRRLPAVASVRRNRVIRAAVTPPVAHAAGVQPFAGAAAIGAPTLWDRGITGGGVVVAVLDSGVDASHPALAASFKGGKGSWFDPSGQHPRAPVDTNGHGTWATGIIVGSGAGGTPVGVAPGARWIAAKVFDDRGKTTTARVHAALQWALDPDGNPRTRDAPQVLNASWDMSGSGCDLEFESDLRELRSAGIVPVFAAGNDLHDASPANNPSALAVGAVDAAGALARGSGRGPSACGTGVYPQVVAPGVDIVTTDLFGLATTQTGTSVAAPYASGALALLLARFPSTSAQRQEAALTAGAADLGSTGADQHFGHGRVDVAAAERWLERAPDVTLDPARWTVTARGGSTATAQVTLRARHGFRGRVRLSGRAAIAGARGRPVREIRLRDRAVAHVEIAIPRGARSGTHPLTISARSGSLSRSLTLGLLVRGSPHRRGSP